MATTLPKLSSGRCSRYRKGNSDDKEHHPTSGYTNQTLSKAKSRRVRVTSPPHFVKILAKFDKSFKRRESVITWAWASESKQRSETFTCSLSEEELWQAPLSGRRSHQSPSPLLRCFVFFSESMALESFPRFHAWGSTWGSLFKPPGSVIEIRHFE